MARNLTQQATEIERPVASPESLMVIGRDLLFFFTWMSVRHRVAQIQTIQL